MLRVSLTVETLHVQELRLNLGGLGRYLRGHGRQSVLINLVISQPWGLAPVFSTGPLINSPPGVSHLGFYFQSIYIQPPLDYF